MSRAIPGPRGLPNDIAQTVVVLASDESAFTVGSELIIDLRDEDYQIGDRKTGLVKDPQSGRLCRCP